MTAAQMTPEGADDPLSIEDYTFSEDEWKLLIYTNSRRVWRAQHARRLLGARPRRGQAQAARRRRARVHADVRQVLARRRPRGLRAASTTSTSRTSRRRASRRSPPTAPPPSSTARSTGSTRRSSASATASAGAPTATHIAYWQIDAEGVRDFLLINNTDSLYPLHHADPVPEGGQRTPRRGSAWSRADGRRDALAPSSPAIRATTTSRGWTGRRPRRVRHPAPRPAAADATSVMLADADTAEAAPSCARPTTPGSTSSTTCVWLDDGEHFTWVSERDGWQPRLRRLARRLARCALVTPVDYDVISRRADRRPTAAALLPRLARQRRHQRVSVPRRASTAAASASGSRPTTSRHALLRRLARRQVRRPHLLDVRRSRRSPTWSACRATRWCASCRQREAGAHSSQRSGPGRHRVLPGRHRRRRRRSTAGA